MRVTLLFCSLIIFYGCTNTKPGQIFGPKPNNEYPVFEKTITFSEPSLAAEVTKGQPVVLKYYTSEPFKKAIKNSVFINPTEHLFSAPTVEPELMEWTDEYVRTAFLPEALNELIPVNHHTSGATMGWQFGEEYVCLPRARQQTVIEYQSADFSAGTPEDLLVSDRGPIGLDAPYYLKEGFITNKEYREFIEYVRDSIARRILGEDVDKEFFVREPDETIPPLNWEKFLDWSNPKYKEALADMKHPLHERVTCIGLLDARKLVHDYYMPVYPEFPDKSLLYNKINIYPDTLRWLGEDYYPGNIEDAIMQKYLWDWRYNSYPVIGLSPYQVQAFLEWKTENHNAFLRSGNKPPEMVVQYALPTRQDAKAYPPDSVRHVQLNAARLSYWRITAGDYRKFVEYARDSVIRTLLAENVDPSYYTAISLQKETPKLDWTKPIIWEYGETITMLNNMQLLNPAVNLGVTLIPAAAVQENLKAKVFHHKADYFDMKAAPPQLDLSFTNVLGQNDGKLGHEDRSRLIKQAFSYLLPSETEWRQKRGEHFLKNTMYDAEVMVGISYPQAVNYFRWRQHSKGFSADAEDLYIPTEQQWKDAMRKRFPNSNELSAPVPGPFFRYVVIVKSLSE